MFLVRFYNSAGDTLCIADKYSRNFNTYEEAYETVISLLNVARGCGAVEVCINDFWFDIEDPD